MRPLLLLTLVALLGCAVKPQEEADRQVEEQAGREAQEPTEREVLQWLEKDHSLWYVTNWESPGVLRRAEEFDRNAWLDEAKKTPGLERVLRRMLEENDPRIDPMRVVWALGDLGDPESVPVLIDCLDSEDFEVQMHAAMALGSLRDPRAVRPLGSRLVLAVEDDINVLGCLVTALGDIGGEAAHEYSRRAADAGDSGASELAREILGEMEAREEAGETRQEEAPATDQTMW